MVSKILVGVALAATAAMPARRPKVDDRADTQLRRMSDYLGGLKTFRVDTQSVDEVVLKSGQKIQRVASSEVSVRRPNGLRVDRAGPIADVTLIYDGKQVGVIGNRSGYWAAAPAPPTLDAAIDDFRDRLGLDAPGADLLFGDVYDGLMDNVTSGTYVGLESIHGVEAHHLAFTGPDVDWQIWIQDGAQPLPLRYVITSKTVKSHPEFTVDLSNWQPNAPLDANAFVFQPPAGGQRIDFAIPEGGKS